MTGRRSSSRTWKRAFLCVCLSVAEYFRLASTANPQSLRLETNVEVVGHPPSDARMKSLGLKLCIFCILEYQHVSSTSNFDIAFQRSRGVELVMVFANADHAI